MMSRKISKAILITTLLQLSGALISVEFPYDPEEFGTVESRGTTCWSNRSLCSILCSDEVNLNICDPTTLQFDCTCASNNSAPGLQYYAGSISDYMCRRTASDCMDDNEGNSTALATCTSIRNKCGYLDRTKFTAPPVVSSAFTLSTGDPKPTSGSTASSNTVPTTSSGPGSSVAAPINSTPNPTSLADSDSASSSKSTLSTGEKAGIGAGAAIAGLLIIGAIGFFFYRAGKRSSAAAAAAAAAGSDDSQKDSEKDAVKDSDAVVFGPELADTQRLEIGGREIPGELEGGAGSATLESVVVPVEMGMSEREESEVRRVLGNK